MHSALRLSENTIEDIIDV